MAATGTTPLDGLPRFDPNATKFVDHSKKDQDLQENFMKILTAQLQYQDPMKPMENAEFTSQMAQFYGLEQQKKGNSLLEQLAKANNTDSLNQGVSYLGREVVREGNHTALKDGEGTLYFELSAPAQATVSLFNSEGTKVEELPLTSYETGMQVVQIDNPELLDGDYTFSVRIREDGTAARAPTATLLQSGIVGSVFRENDATLLNVDGVKTPLGQIRMVRERRLV